MPFIKRPKKPYSTPKTEVMSKRVSNAAATGLKTEIAKTGRGMMKKMYENTAGPIVAPPKSLNSLKRRK